MHRVRQRLTLWHDTLGNQDPRTLFHRRYQIPNNLDAVLIIQEMQYKPHKVCICLLLLHLHKVNHLELKPMAKIFWAVPGRLRDGLRQILYDELQIRRCTSDFVADVTISCVCTPRLTRST